MRNVDIDAGVMHMFLSITPSSLSSAVSRLVVAPRLSVRPPIPTPPNVVMNLLRLHAKSRMSVTFFSSRPLQPAQQRLVIDA